MSERPKDRQCENVHTHREHTYAIVDDMLPIVADGGRGFVVVEGTQYFCDGMYPIQCRVKDVHDAHPWSEPYQGQRWCEGVQAQTDSRLMSQPALVSALQPWLTPLPIQQQSVLFLATRGPDGINKAHPIKNVIRAYRATVILAAARRRPMEWGEEGDGFMTLHLLADDTVWTNCIRRMCYEIDDIPHHYLMHLMHGAEIIGYKHPDDRFSAAWSLVYHELVNDMHLSIETEQQMDARLNDFGGAWP